MESIDNAFFLMALQHGILAVTVFAAIFLYAIASQLKFALKAPAGEPPIGFTFAGIYVMCFIAFSTVYMGSQTEPMLFLLLGWGESIKRRSGETAAGNVPPPAAPAFRRVIT
jgi:dolichyl-phosphate-mannose--protein O-mannosyl transferase